MTRSHLLIKDIATDVRKELKRQYPNCKFSVTIKRFTGGRELNVSLMAAPYSPFARLNNTLGDPINPGYAQINELHINQDQRGNWISNGVYLTPQAAQMLKDVSKIMNMHNWDNSDLMADYFDVNYYTSLSIGQWDKDFTVTK